MEIGLLQGLYTYKAYVNSCPKRR